MLRKEALKILDTVVLDEARGGLTEAWQILRKELVEEKFTSANSAMDAIAERYINEVSFLDSSDAGTVRSFVAYLQQQHQ